MTDTTTAGGPIDAPVPGQPMLAADGTPLKRSLARALRVQKLRALALIAPLLIFVLATFVAPIGDMLFRSVENEIVVETLPESVPALRRWDPAQEELPGDDVYYALMRDLFVAAEAREHTRLGSRLNYERPGMSSMMRKSGRGVEDIAEARMDALVAADPAWEDAATWAALVEAREDLPATASAWDAYRAQMAEDEDDPLEEDPWPLLAAALERDLGTGTGTGMGAEGPMAAELSAAAGVFAGLDLPGWRAEMAEVDEDWIDPEVMATIKLYSPRFTPGYFLNAVDMQLTPEGLALQPETQRLYLKLFWRTLVMSLIITGACILLGYPVAYLLANLPASKANLLMILVLLPFWTSLLVRTSAWKVLLQSQGVINDVLVWIGLIDDAGRLVMINNATGTIIAMTHILLPFMILPLYSVMQTIPPSYMRAARSLGATDWTAFRRVYFPQSVPGIGAGSILVFILAIGYYITPELVGGTDGVFISNRIAFHISSSLNWGLAAALGAILLAVVLILYWTYDRIVGIDNVKLG